MKPIPSVIIFAATMLSGCALIFGRPMNQDEFKKAVAYCGLQGATLAEGNYMRGNPSIIKAPPSVRPSDWDGKTECVAKLFGGDGVMKAPSNSFEMRFTG